MFKKTDILSNAVSLAIVGTKINLTQSLLLFMFRRKAHPKVLCTLDKKLVSLRKEFIISEKRRSMLLSVIDI